MPTEAPIHLSPIQEKAWYRTWVICLSLFFVLLGGLPAIQQLMAKQNFSRETSMLLDEHLPDPGVTAPEDVDTKDALRVEVGFYLERIESLSVKDASWTAVFNVWFRWKGDQVNPTGDFVIMGANIESKEQQDSRSENGEHYERYLVTAKIFKPFSVAQFPIDEHLLLLALESASLTRDKVLFVPDVEGTSISSRVFVPGYRIKDYKELEKPHSYKTTRGDPRLTPGTKSTHSQIRLGVRLERDGWGLYFKMFQALFVAVFIAFLACFIKPTDVDPRFGLGVGALFATVANAYIIGDQVPHTGELALADEINFLGILTILATLVESTLSLYLYDQRDEKALSKHLDVTSFKIMFSGFILANLLLVVVALL